MVLQKQKPKPHAGVKIKEYGQVSCDGSTKSTALNLALYLIFHRPSKQPK